MKLFTLFIILAVSSHLSLFSRQVDTPKTKKIVIVESNNERLDNKENTIPFRIDISDSSLFKLREYVTSQIHLPMDSDPQTILSVMEWVRNQWAHDGFNEPPASATSLEILKLAQQGSKI